MLLIFFYGNNICKTLLYLLKIIVQREHWCVLYRKTSFCKMSSVLSIARRYSFTAKHIFKRPREYNLHVGCFFPHFVYLYRRKATQSNFATTKHYLNTRISHIFFLLSEWLDSRECCCPVQKHTLLT